MVLYYYLTESGAAYTVLYASRLVGKGDLLLAVTVIMYGIGAFLSEIHLSSSLEIQPKQQS